jgi:restriction endonuclease S subunit
MKTRLGDIVEIRSGVTLRGRDATRPDPNGRYRMIRISDLSPDGRLLADQFTPINPDEEVKTDFILKPDDILFACRGVRMQAAVFNFPKIANAIAGAQFFLIRRLPSILLPDFLVWAINSVHGQAYFTENTSGSYVPLVTSDILKNFAFDVPSLDVQRRIVKLHELGQREEHLQTKIAQSRKHLLEGQLQHIVKTAGSKKLL